MNEKTRQEYRCRECGERVYLQESPEDGPQLVERQCDRCDEDRDHLATGRSLDAYEQWRAA